MYAEQMLHQRFGGIVLLVWVWDWYSDITGHPFCHNLAE
jgi:hypothetical protein